MCVCASISVASVAKIPPGVHHLRRLQRCTDLNSYILPILVPTVCFLRVHYIVFHWEASLDCIVHKFPIIQLIYAPNPSNLSAVVQKLSNRAYAPVKRPLCAANAISKYPLSAGFRPPSNQPLQHPTPHPKTPHHLTDKTPPSED